MLTTPFYTNQKSKFFVYIQLPRVRVVQILVSKIRLQISFWFNLLVISLILLTSKLLVIFLDIL